MQKTFTPLGQHAGALYMHAIRRMQDDLSGSMRFPQVWKVLLAKLALAEGRSSP